MLYGLGGSRGGTFRWFGKTEIAVGSSNGSKCTVSEKASCRRNINSAWFSGWFGYMFAWNTTYNPDEMEVSRGTGAPGVLNDGLTRIPHVQSTMVFTLDWYKLMCALNQIPCSCSKTGPVTVARAGAK